MLDFVDTLVVELLRRSETSRGSASGPCPRGNPEALIRSSRSSRPKIASSSAGLTVPLQAALPSREMSTIQLPSNSAPAISQHVIRPYRKATFR